MKNKMIDYCQVGDTLLIVKTKKIVKVIGFRRDNQAVVRSGLFKDLDMLISMSFFLNGSVIRIPTYNEKLNDLL